MAESIKLPLLPLFPSLMSLLVAVALVSAIVGSMAEDAGPFITFESLAGRPYNVSSDARSFMIDGQVGVVNRDSFHAEFLTFLFVLPFAFQATSFNSS